MHPELINIPGLFTIKTYGFFLMIGFLSAVWMAMKRAARVGVDPDRILDVSFVALVFGLAGARLFYVVHYWHTQFADTRNKVLAVLDIRQGGLEFLGGLLGAAAAIVVYLWIKKQSIRLFLDVLAPGAMWGVAFGRLGCFFNGCCFGGVCDATNAHAAQVWTVQFPYGSPAHRRQWEDRMVTVPAELIPTNKGDLMAWPVGAELLEMPPARRDLPQRKYADAQKALETAKESKANEKTLQALGANVEAVKKAMLEHESTLETLRRAQLYPSRESPDRRITISELQKLAEQSRALPVHPTQLYASIHGFILYALLTAVFYVRKRHGAVIGLLFVMYPITRFLEETIRTDNPRDVLGMTASQFVSLSMFVVGAVYLCVLYLRLPQRSPRADAAAPEPELVAA